uniref:hypothetical protein n=1 Tax=Providencia stuartii TaxID=588 RepID=UPI001952C632
DFCILLNRGTAPIGICRHGSHFLVAPGRAHLSTNGEAAEILADARCDANTVTVERGRSRGRRCDRCIRLTASDASC